MEHQQSSDSAAEAVSLIPSRSFVQATSTTVPQGKEGARPVARSPIMAKSIAVPHLFMQRKYNPEDVENPHRISGLVSEILSEGRGEFQFPSIIEGFYSGLSKYWCQRYEGIQMDEGWFSVTPESIAKHHAHRCANGTLVDFFTGVGGNAVQFTQRCRHVIAKAFELAEAYADDDEAKHGINELGKITRKKLECFVQEWGSDVVKDDATPNPATSKCTEFLLAIASGKTDGIKPFEKTKLSAYILGAITSCISLNAYIGKEVRGVLCEHHQSNHPYKKWIENCSSDSFQDFCLQTEELLDNLSVALTGEELGIIERLYCQGIKHETEFLLAQPVIEKAVVPLSGEHNRVMIFSGFDLTCSFVDSCAILAELTIATAPKSDQISIENQFARMTLSDLRDNWEVNANKYTDGYEQCIEKLLLATEKAKKLNYEGLRKAIEQVSDFEKEANLRVIESGVLKGLKLEDIRQAGEDLKLQDGGLDDLKVHANELEFEESLSTGEIMKKVQSPH